MINTGHMFAKISNSVRLQQKKKQISVSVANQSPTVQPRKYNI